MDRVPVHDTRTDRIFPVLLATVGLAQARPSKLKAFVTCTIIELST